MTVIKNLVSNKVATRAKNSNSKPINTNRSYNIFTSTNEIFSRSKTFIFDSLKLLQGNLDISRRLLKTSSRVSAIDEGRGPLELQGMQLLTKFHAIMDSKLQQPNKVVAATPSASANIALTNFQGVSKLIDKEVILGRIPFTASDLRSALQEKLQSAGTQPISLKGEGADHSISSRSTNIGVSVQMVPRPKAISPLVSANSVRQKYGTSTAAAASSSSSSSVSHRPLTFSSLDLKTVKLRKRSYDDVSSTAIIDSVSKSNKKRVENEEIVRQKTEKPFHISDILNVRLRPVRVSVSSPLCSQTAKSTIVQENHLTKPKKAFCISDILSVKLRPVGLQMVTRSRLSTSSRGASSEKGGLLDSSSKLFSTKRTPSSKSKDLAVTQKSMHSALKQALQGRFSKAIPNQSMHIDTEPNSPMSDW